MGWREEISIGLENIAKRANHGVFASVFDATVISINEETRTCIVESEKLNISDLEVRLISEISDGDLSIPEVDSTILVAALSGVTKPFLISASWLTKKVLTVQDQGYLIQEGSQQFNDGEFGGLVKVIELTQKINNLEKDINNLKTILQSWIVSSGDGGAALKTALAPYYTKLTVTSRSDIENAVITHGDKI